MDGFSLSALLSFSSDDTVVLAVFALADVVAPSAFAGVGGGTVAASAASFSASLAAYAANLSNNAITIVLILTRGCN